MLKIERRHGDDGEPSLKLAGEISGPWVEELRRVTEAALAVAAPLRLDLSDVAFVDRDGVALLSHLGEREVTLVNCSAFVTELLGPAAMSAEPVGSLPSLTDSDYAAAIDRLMAEYSGRVYRLAYGITRNHSDAEEVMQDVFLTVLKKGDTFEGRSKLSSWIYRVTTNAAYNKRRGKRYEVEVPIGEHLPRFEPDGRRSGTHAYLVADWSRDPEHSALAGETRRVLEHALDTLPSHYRAVLVLRDVEDLSNEQVADILGESVGSVKSRLHRARMAVREQLTQHLAG